MAELQAVRLKRPLRIGGTDYAKGDVVTTSLIGLPAAEDWVKRGIAEEAGERAAKEAAKAEGVSNG